MMQDEDDWIALHTLVESIGDDEEFDPSACRALLQRIGPTVGVTSEACEAAALAQGAAGLARKLRRLIAEGDARFYRAITHARELEGQGKRDDARRVLQDFIGKETVDFFREMAEYRLGTLTDS
jgi:DUSAM domain-containing protein